MAPRGMVVSPHALASEAGVEVLKAGGSAVDAAIATSAALAVIYPHMTSVGGDAFWLIYDSGRDAVRYLDGAGRAAASAGVEWFRERGMSEIPYRGALPATLTVPGGVASWSEAHAAYGRMPFVRNLDRAIELARDGFPVTERLAKCIGATLDQGAFDDHAKAIFLRDGRPPRTGTRLDNPHLARTLGAIADRGRDGFYAGEVAQELDRYARAAGGFFDAADLAAQTATWGEPIAGTYRDVTVYETPAPTQGFTVLEMLNMLESYDVGAWDFLGPDHVHHLVQAKQIAYHDRDTLLADPAYAGVPIERLISKAYAADRRRLIDAPRAVGHVPAYGPYAATPCTSAQSTPTATPPRSSRASTGSSAPALSPAGPGWCCRTAARISRSIPAIRTASRPARSRPTPSSHRSRSGRASCGRCSAAWGRTASRRFTCRPMSVSSTSGWTPSRRSRRRAGCRAASDSATRATC
jgi:gamma-glutamyltranspeptidase/glutathione hydrolase